MDSYQFAVSSIRHLITLARMKNESLGIRLHMETGGLGMRLHMMKVSFGMKRTVLLAAYLSWAGDRPGAVSLQNRKKDDQAGVESCDHLHVIHVEKILHCLESEW